MEALLANVINVYKLEATVGMDISAYNALQAAIHALVLPQTNALLANQDIFIILIIINVFQLAPIL